MDISVTRVREKYWDNIDAVIALEGKRALEVGCGNGDRSIEIARRCRLLYGIDPNDKAIRAANRRNITNATFDVGSIESARLRERWFDVVFFTMSFHHVAPSRMAKAIDVAINTCKTDGHIVFVEPNLDGSLYDAEALFNACDGDEREAKKTAQDVIDTHPHLRCINCFEDESIFRFRSFQSFIAMTGANRNLAHLTTFLKEHQEGEWYVLRAPRKIWVCSPA